MDATEAPAWSPDCMDPSEWTEWQALNPRLRLVDFAARPCADCPASWAAEMARAGRCNGEPLEQAA